MTLCALVHFPFVSLLCYFGLCAYDNSTEPFIKRRVNTNFCNNDSANSEVCAHRLVVHNSNHNGWITRYCTRVPDGEHMVQTVVMWMANHAFGFYQNKFGICNAFQNFTSNFFKCVENNEEVSIDILSFYPKNSYQRVYGAGGTRFMGLRDCIDSMYHYRKNINDNDNKTSESNENVDVNDCETDDKAMEFVFGHCMQKNTTLHQISNDSLLDRSDSSEENATNSDDSSNHDSDLEQNWDEILSTVPTPHSQQNEIDDNNSKNVNNDSKDPSTENNDNSHNAQHNTDNRPKNVA